MSGNQGFGSSANGSSYTAGDIYSDGISLPTGRTLLDGGKDCLITRLFAYVGGTSGARTGVYLTLGSASTGTFTVPQQPSASGVGYYGTNHWRVQGGTARFTVHNAPTGPLYFSRGGSGTTYGPAGFSRSGTLGGAYTWVEGPSAPRDLALSLTGVVGEISVEFDSPSDNGGTAVTGYKIYYWADDEAVNAHSVDVTGSAVLQLTPGKTYSFRVSAKNVVTEAADTVGPQTSTASIFLPSSGKVFNGSAFVNARGRVYDGSWKDSVTRTWRDGEWKTAR